MAKTISEWLTEGQVIYETAINEYRSLEEQAAEIQQRLIGKRAEVNQVAKMIGKPAIDDTGGPAAAPGGVDVIDPGNPNAAPYTRNSIARALTGQPLRR